MRTERVKAVATIFEIEELQAMEKTCEALEELITRVGTDHTLESVQDGELVGISELLRVRGILDALCRNRCWEVRDEPFAMIGSEA